MLPGVKPKRSYLLESQCLPWLAAREIKDLSMYLNSESSSCSRRNRASEDTGTVFSPLCCLGGCRSRSASNQAQCRSRPKRRGRPRWRSAAHRCHPRSVRARGPGRGGRNPVLAGRASALPGSSGRSACRGSDCPPWITLVSSHPRLRWFWSALTIP